MFYIVNRYTYISLSVPEPCISDSDYSRRNRVGSYDAAADEINY